MQNLRPQTKPARALWIDAICINQADDDERSQQVNMMRQIYIKADHVAVWVGNGDEKTQKFIKTAKKIGGHWSSYQDDISAEKYTQKLARLHLEGLDIDGFVDLFFDAPWFHRTWVVQEIFNATSATVHCGQDTLTWPMVLKINDSIGRIRLNANSRLKRKRAYGAFMAPIFADLFSLFNTDEDKNSPDHQSSQLDALDIFIKGLDLDASNPRDKIFALLQFGKEAKQTLTDPLPSEIRPDYRKSVSQVFTDFTRWYIMTHQSLRVLSAIQALTGRTWQVIHSPASEDLPPDLPSWSLHHLGHTHWAENTLGLLSKDCAYHAAGTTKVNTDIILASHDASHTDQQALLPLTGLRIARIKEVNTYPYYNRASGIGIGSDLNKDMHKAYLALFAPVDDGGKWASSNTSRWHGYFTPGTNEEYDHRNTHYAYAVETGGLECHSKCFFRTHAMDTCISDANATAANEEGEGEGVDGLMGLCPASAKPGDLVVVLHGGNVPYLLREVENEDDVVAGAVAGEKAIRRYEFVGECYLQGYMDGRAVREQEAKKLAIETFGLV